MAYLSALVLGILTLTNSNEAIAASAHTVTLSEDQFAQVAVSPEGTVVRLPEQPTQVVLGKKSSFHIKAVGSDLLISPLTKGASSNLYIYTPNFKYSLRLRYTQKPPYQILKITNKSTIYLEVPWYEQ